MNSDFVRTLTEMERRAELDRAVMSHIRQGAVVLGETSTEALLFYPGKRLNNVLHAILSILTFGMWLFVWAVVAIYCALNAGKQFTVSVDEHGRVYNDLRTKHEPDLAKVWIFIGIAVLLIVLVLV